MAVIYLFSLALVALASAENLCSRGESYWCSNIRVAKQCGAVQHCVDTVWKNTAPVKDNTDVCQFCKAIVLDVRNLINDAKSQQQIKDYLQTACGVIPDKMAADECKDIVSNYLPEIFMLLETFADPDTICNALGICKGFRDQVLYGDAVTVKKEPICTDCKKFIGDIRDLITDKTTEDEVKSLLKAQLCSSLGALADECNQFVDAYTPEILKLLSEQVEPEVICGALGVCDGNRSLLAVMRMQQSPLYKEASKVASGATCIACEAILTDLQIVIRDPAVQVDVVTFLNNNLCAKIGTLKQTCLDTVKIYSKTIFELIVNEMDPKVRCKAFGFCPAAGIDTLTPVPEVKVVKDDKVAISTQCVLCEFVIKELDSLLIDNATEAQFIDALNKVCFTMPDTIKFDCQLFVNTYGPGIFELLKQELQPEEMCTTLGLCAATASTVQGHALLFKPKTSVGNAQMCAVCETVMAYVTTLLKQNSTEVQLEHVLQKVCNFLPKNLQQECTTLMDQYGRQIIDIVIKSASPKQVCSMLQLCTSASVTPPAKPQPIVGAKSCIQGPSYWCSSKETAEECKATIYCQRMVWHQPGL